MKVYETAFLLAALRVEKDGTQRCSSRVRRNPVFPQRRRNQGGASPSPLLAATTAGSGAQGKGGARRRAAQPAPRSSAGSRCRSPRRRKRHLAHRGARSGARRHSDAVRQPPAGPPRPARPRPGPRSRGARGHGAGPAPLLSGAEARGWGAWARRPVAGGRRKVFRG